MEVIRSVPRAVASVRRRADSQFGNFLWNKTRFFTGSDRSSPQCCRNLREASVDLQTEIATKTDHFIGAGGGTSDAKHGITLFEKSNGDGMEDLIEGVVANTARSGKFNQRESQPLTKNRDVPGAEERERVRLHFIDVFQDQSRIVIRAGTVGTSDQNHQGIARVCVHK
jgi:hypothetical protein